MFQLPHDRLDDVLIYTPLKKEISALAVLIVQAGFWESTAGFVAVVFSFSVCKVTGTIVSFCGI
jgi:hypothetical protein